MHTFQHTDEDGIEWTVHHNGDFSGDVFMNNEEWTIGRAVGIPFDLLREIVGLQMLAKQVARLEDLDGNMYLDSLGT